MKTIRIVWLIVVAVCLVGSVRAADLKLVLSDNIGKEWVHEPIYWDVDLKPGEWKGGNVQVERDGKPIPAQAVATERYAADGSAKSVRITVIVDRLERDGTTTLTAQLGKSGPNETDLSVQKGNGFLILANRFTAVKVVNRNVSGEKEGMFSPILGVRTASGKWTDAGRYEAKTAKPVGTKTEMLESGPVRLAARVTTTFDNGRTHVVTLSLLSGSHSIDIDESFDLGPDDKYRFKEFTSDRDELAWEWWSWYGDVDGTQEDHPNNWLLPISSAEYRPVEVRYRGEASTDSARGPTNNRGEAGYTLLYDHKQRMEKYLAGHDQWRPDAVTWYATSPSQEEGADVVALYTHSVRNWRNPNVLPLSNITLRTGANDMRILSFGPQKQLAVACPIGLGRRVWSIRCSTVAETFNAISGNGQRGPSMLSAEIVQHNLGLDITRKWVTRWPNSQEYPRLFIKSRDKAAYYAGLKGSITAGSPLERFLHFQDAANARMLYESTVAEADRMIDGYFRTGLDTTNGYPGWMQGYWQGIAFASNLDNLLGTPFCTPEMAANLRKKMAILTYCLTSKDAWSDKRINYGWGSMNMPVGRWGGLVVMASSISDHPMAQEWLKDADRYFRMVLKTEYSPDGVAISCPHYIEASSTTFYAWIALANSGIGEDVSRDPVLRNFARYYMQLMTPIDRRWGIRTLITEGDTRPGSSGLPGLLATLFRRSDPDLAGQLMQIWREGGQEVTGGMGVPDRLIIDPSLASVPPKLGSEVFPGFGAILRQRPLGTPEESYLSFLAGDFMIDHTNTDQMAFEWYEKGVPLTLYTGDMYVPGARTALSHNTLCWDVRPEGGPTPGKDQPGDWYHDHNLPWFEHTKRPRLHLEIGWEQSKQKITDTRGKVTVAGENPAATLIEGKVPVLTLTEVPTKSDYSPAMLAQIPTPLVPLKAPFTWTRRLLNITTSVSTGINYLVIRDDQQSSAEHTPSFNYWSLSGKVEPSEHGAHFTGQLGVDTELFFASPARVKVSTDAFTHTQSEGIVASLNQKRYGKPFSETQILARAEGEAGKGFLAVVFPHNADEPNPVFERWAGDQGIKLSWKRETHYVLLDIVPRTVHADGIEAETSCLIAKVTDPRNFVLSLPAGGSARYAGQSVTGSGPVELRVVDGKATRVTGKDLLPH